MSPEQRQAMLFVMRVTGKSWKQVVRMPMKTFMRIIEEWNVPETPRR